MADHFSGAVPIDLAELAWQLVYLKHSDWKYEKEWRCYWPLLDQPVGVGYNDPVQDSRLFEAIYLGCNMSPEERAEITALTRQYLPQTEVYQARKSKRSFDLEFDLVAD